MFRGARRSGVYRPYPRCRERCSAGRGAIRELVLEMLCMRIRLCLGQLRLERLGGFLLVFWSISGVMSVLAEVRRTLSSNTAISQNAQSFPDMVLDPVCVIFAGAPSVLFLVLVCDIIFPRRDQPVQYCPLRNWRSVDTGTRRYGYRGVSQDGVVNDRVETGRKEVDEFDAMDAVN